MEYYNEGGGDGVYEVDPRQAPCDVVGVEKGHEGCPDYSGYAGCCYPCPAVGEALDSVAHNQGGDDGDYAGGGV